MSVSEPNLLTGDKRVKKPWCPSMKVYYSALDEKAGHIKHQDEAWESTLK